MSKTMVRNISPGAVTLPPPYTGILPPGVAVIIDDIATTVAAALFIIPETRTLLTLTEVSNANQTTLPVSREAAADTIATQTLASLTSPLDLNGQPAINVADPVAPQDAVTLAYFNAHGGGGGGGVAFAQLGEVDAPGGPYPGIPAGLPVAIVGGAVVIANANSTSAMPCQGVYTGAATNRIRTSGKVDGLVGLPANARLYVAPGGGLTATPPVGVGHVVHPVGVSVGTTVLFVGLEDPTYL